MKTLSGFNREFGEPFGIAVRDDEIFVSDGERGTILRIGLDGSVTPYVSGLNTPSSMALTAEGHLVVADTGSNTIKKIGLDGTVSLIAGISGKRGFADGPAQDAMFNGPIGIAVGKDDRIYVSDTYNDRIRVIKDGLVTTLAGGERGFAEGFGSSARFDTPLGIAMWEDKLLVADSENKRIRVVENDGAVWTLTGNGSNERKDGPMGLASFVFPTAVTTDNGIISIVDGNAVRLIGRRVFPFVETVSSERHGLIDGEASNARFNRPSGLAVLNGKLLVTDSDNQLVRIFAESNGSEITVEKKHSLRFSPEEFRTLQPARWPYDPPQAKREIAGTLGEVRGEVSDKRTASWFHNGLDIAGGYGETARFVRSEMVLDPATAQNFGTTRELIRMPTMGYIHIRLGRDQNDRTFEDDRFQFLRDKNGKVSDVRIPRGAYFTAGEPIGTLNTLNHVHLIAGRSGSEMNALDALVLPGVSDSVSPTIETVSLLTENWQPVETESGSARIKTDDRIRILARAYDRVDGNSERRRLGVFALKYLVLDANENVTIDPGWTIRFDRLPSNDAVPFAYAVGSKSGPTGETIFNYIVTDRVEDDDFAEGYLDASKLPRGIYIIRVIAADFFGNSSSKDLKIEVKK